VSSRGSSTAGARLVTPPRHPTARHMHARSSTLQVASVFTDGESRLFDTNEASFRNVEYVQVLPAPGVSHPSPQRDGLSPLSIAFFLSSQRSLEQRERQRQSHLTNDLWVYCAAPHVW